MGRTEEFVLKFRNKDNKLVINRKTLVKVQLLQRPTYLLIENAVNPIIITNNEAIDNNGEMKIKFFI